MVALDKPGLSFSIAVSDRITPESGDDLIEKVYAEARNGTDNQPRLILAFMPIIADLTANRFMPRLFELAGDIPVFGGMALDGFDSRNYGVFAGGAAHSDRIVLVLLGGEIDPVFSVGCSVTETGSYSPVVTEAERNVVYKVDDISFCQYLNRLGFSGHVAKLRDFPLCIVVNDDKQSPVDGIPIITHLAATNTDDGSGIFANDIPVGSSIRIGVVTRDDLASSSQSCVSSITREIRKREENGYAFSLAFCITCLGRYFALLGGENIDGEAIRSSPLGNMPLFGYYAYNEVCPSVAENGMSFNRTFSDSIAICAF